jgi:hypothetical protein
VTASLNNAIDSLSKFGLTVGLTVGVDVPVRVGTAVAGIWGFSLFPTIFTSAAAGFLLLLAS